MVPAMVLIPRDALETTFMSRIIRSSPYEPSHSLDIRIENLASIVNKFEFDIPFVTTPINQSNFYSVNIPGEARLSGATAKSVFNSKIEETVP